MFVGLSDWDKVVFMDESQFAMQTDEKRLMVCREESRYNPLQRNTEHNHSDVEVSYCDTGFECSIVMQILTCRFFRQGVIYDGCLVSRWNRRTDWDIVRVAISPDFDLMNHNTRLYRVAIFDCYLECEMITCMLWLTLMYLKIFSMPSFRRRLNLTQPPPFS